MKTKLFRNLAILAFGASVLSGCGSTMTVTRYPKFWDYPGQYNTVAIAPAQGTYNDLVDMVFDGNVESSGWYEVYDYSYADQADLVFRPVVSDYDLGYSVSVDTYTEYVRGDYEDGASVSESFLVSEADITYKGTSSMYVQVYSNQEGKVIHTINASDYCVASSHWEPRLPPLYFRLRGGPGPNGEHPDRPRQPLPPPPTTESPEMVYAIASDIANHELNNYWRLVECAVKDMAASASKYVYPVNKSITVYAKKVFQFVQNGKTVSNVEASQGDSFTVLFTLPDDASFNQFVVDIVSSENMDQPLVSHNIEWDKANPMLEFDLSASRLKESSGNQTKYYVRLWKDGKLILKRDFKIK